MLNKAACHQVHYIVEEVIDKALIWDCLGLSIFKEIYTEIPLRNAYP